MPLTRARAASRDRPARTAPEATLGPDSFHDVIGYHLRVAQDASFEAFRRRVGNRDLQPGRYTVLRVLAETPGLTPTELSRALRRDKSTLTPALRDLQARGLVERRATPDDQRSYRVNLTTEGAALLARLRHHAEGHDNTLDRIVGDDKALLIEILSRIAHRLGERPRTPLPADRDAARSGRR